MISGADLSRNPKYNKGLAFTEIERDRLYLRGLLPPAILSQDVQVGDHDAGQYGLHLNCHSARQNSPFSMLCPQYGQPRHIEQSSKSTGCLLSFLTAIALCSKRQACDHIEADRRLMQFRLSLPTCSSFRMNATSATGVVIGPPWYLSPFIHRSNKQLCSSHTLHCTDC